MGFQNPLQAVALLGGTIGAPRTYTPGSAAAQDIGSGSARQTGVGSEAGIANYLAPADCRIKLEGQFRLQSTGGLLEHYVLVDGVTVAYGLYRRTTDETALITGVVDLAAGSHALALRVFASGGAGKWFGGSLTFVTGNRE